MFTEAEEYQNPELPEPYSLLPTVVMLAGVS